MKEKIVTLVKILSEGNIVDGNIFLNGPFYIGDIVIKDIRIFDGDPEFSIEHNSVSQFGDFELWILYSNMRNEHLEILLERLANLL